MPKRLNAGFAAIVVGFGVVVHYLYRDEVLGPVLAPLAEATARITAALIPMFGMEAIRNGTVLSHPAGFAYQVAYTCTGFLPVVSFMVCTLAYPGALRSKLAGIALGVPALLALNYLRLINLFFIGVKAPDAFVLAHEVIWEILQAIVFVSLWWRWMIWSDSPPARR